MKYALVITGVLAALALAAPELVVWGYLLLILPGLALTVAPDSVCLSVGHRRCPPTSADLFDLGCQRGRF
jgi:hypothetical protein